MKKHSKQKVAVSEEYATAVIKEMCADEFPFMNGNNCEFRKNLISSIKNI